MRWIAAVWNESGEAVARAGLEEMMVAGPWASNRYVCSRPEGVSLGAASKPPHTSACLEVDGYSLVADLSLHNQREIQQRLRDAGRHVSPNMSPGQVLLEAYRLWGSAMVSYLVGDFSLIIWDPIKQGLFAARDQMGTRSLYYRLEPGITKVANRLSLLLGAQQQVPLNNAFFKEFVEADGVVDTAHTPYQEILRVPRACWLWADRSGVQVRPYWRLTDVSEPIEYRTVDEYAEHFRELLKEALQCRLSPNSANALALSGGLDSTTLFVLAKQLEAEGRCGPVHYISYVFDKDRPSDERPYITALLERFPHSTGRFVCADDIEIYRNFPSDTPSIEEPKISSTSYEFTRGLVVEASELGCRHLVTGLGGDHLLGGHPCLTSDLLRQGRPGAAIRAAWDYGYGSGLSPLNALWQWAIGPCFGRGSVLSFNQGKLAAQQDVLRRLRYASWKELYQQWLSTVGHIRLDRELEEEFGIPFEHPFLDRRLWEFMYRIPGWLRWRDGQTKFILRRAMQGLLPDQILDRLDKTTQLGQIFNGLRNNWSNIHAAIQPTRIAQRGLTDRDSFLNMVEYYRQGHMIREDIWVLLTLELWLYKIEHTSSW